MIDATQYPFCTDLDVIEKTIYAVASIGDEDKEIRIELLKSLVDGSYHTHTYVKENVTVQRSYTWENGTFTSPPEAMNVWRTWDNFPWTAADSADSALAQALSFLGDRSRK